jgi:hypothetical protein
MRPDALYESWKRRRSAGDVPSGFANRVMTSLHRATRQAEPSGPQRFLAGLFASRLGKLGLCALGCLACAVRILGLVALFLPR